MNSEDPLISVVIPVFNASHCLPELFSSLERQTIALDLFEVIFVDNGSIDGSLDMLTGFARDSALRVLVREEAEVPGSYAARNKGLQYASGDIIGFTDSDCRPHRDWIEEAVACLSLGGAGSKVVGGDVRLYVDADHKPTSSELYEMAFGFEQVINIRQKGFTVTANLWVRYEVIKRVGFFNSELKSKGDFEWCQRARSAAVDIEYASSVVVDHPARSTLSELLTKTRRVVGGQRDVARSGLVEYNPPSWLAFPGRLVNNMIRVFGVRSDFTLLQLMKILSVINLLLVVKYVERVRLSLGGRAERR